MIKLTAAATAIICLATLFLPTAAQAETWEEYFHRINEDYIKGHLELGFRSSYYQFTDSERVQYDANGNPNGYTWGISTSDVQEQPSYIPLPYIMYKFTPYFGLRCSWETIKGKTLTLDKADPHSDGDITGYGPAFELIGRYPNETPVTPYVGLGLTLWNLDFKEDTGFYENGRRVINVDNMTGWLMSAGCTVNLQEYLTARIFEHLSADLELSYMMASADAVFIFQGRQTHAWEFPLDTFYARLGVKYEF